MPWVDDQMGRRVNVPKKPQRIISLVPSQTELLYDLGLGGHVVGITKFCFHPEEWRKEKRIVGGTKQYRHEVIKELSPDLIIGNKEENEKEGIEALAVNYPVWMSDIANLTDALSMINQVGSIVGEGALAKEMIENIGNNFEDLSLQKAPRKALYLIWKKPYMAAGTGTFIDEMMNYAGFENVVIDPRYPVFELDEFVKLKPEVVLLSSEPYPFKGRDITEIQNVLPNARIELVDGEMFSWYGSRLAKAPRYFKGLE
ncbi:ABC transporter substrate-binding protein [Roseivirga sp.]|uniref:ABC transporter substrate-binding protein n=1 Tax=Roseivirga sp. TaxID=1964215 RepID=UPI003B8AF8FB